MEDNCGLAADQETGVYHDKEDDGVSVIELGRKPKNGQGLRTRWDSYQIFGGVR